VRFLGKRWTQFTARHGTYHANWTNTLTDSVALSFQITLTEFFLPHRISLIVGPPRLSCLCTTCVSPALATRRSQWKAFPRFCSEFGLAPILALTRTVIPFVIHLSSYCKNWTIINYLSAINGLSRHFNHYFTFGRLLFLLHINDLPNCYKKLSFGIFADDTYVFYTNDKLYHLETVMNEESKLGFEYCMINKLSINL